MGVTTKGNPEQEELVRVIMDNQHPIIFCTGAAGTGKTFVTLAAALQLQDDGKYGDIIYTRDPVQLGHNMGYLKGGEDEKFAPFMRPLVSNLKAIAKVGGKPAGHNGAERRAALNAKMQSLLDNIETVPLAFFRGDTIDNAILIVDEAQNLSAKDIDSLITRIGTYAKIILLGSMNQIDSREQDPNNCDFQKVIDAFDAHADEFPEYCHVNLVQSKRAPWTARVDNLLSKIK